MMFKVRKKAVDIFRGLRGTVVPWRLLTETKLVLLEERGLTVSLELG